MPKWLSFDSSSWTFYGVPFETDLELIYIAVNVYLDEDSWPSVQEIFIIEVSLPTNTLPVKLGDIFEITLFDADHNELLGNTNSLFSACDIESQNVSIYPLSCPAGSLNIFASIYLACNSTDLSPAQRVMMFVSVGERLRVCPLQLTLQTQFQPAALTIAENNLSKDYNANSVSMSLLIHCEDIDLYSAAIQNTIKILEKFLNNSFFVNNDRIVIQAWTITATTFQAIATPKRLRRQVLPSPTPVQPQITETQRLGSGDNSSDEFMSESIGKATSSILPDPFPSKTTSKPFPFVTSMLLEEISSSLESSVFSLFPDISSLSLEPTSLFLPSVYESILSSDFLLITESFVDFSETLTIMTSDISSNIFLSSLSTETSSSVTISPTFVFLTPTPSDDIFFTSETSLFLYDTSSMDSLVMPTIDPSQMPHTSLDSELVLTFTDMPFVMTSSVVTDISSDFTTPFISDETSLIFVDTTPIEPTFVETSPIVTTSNLGLEFMSSSEFPFITSSLDVSVSDIIFQTSVPVGVSPSGDLTSFLSDDVMSQTSVDFIEALSPSPSQPFFSSTADEIFTMTLESPSPNFEEPFSSVSTELFSSIKLTASPFPSIIPPPPGPPPPSLDTSLVTESSDLFLETSSFLPPFSTDVFVTLVSMLTPEPTSSIMLPFSFDFDDSPVPTSSEATLISSIETPFSSDFDDSLVPISSEPRLISSMEVQFSSDFDDSQIPMSTLFPESSSSMKFSSDFDGSSLPLSTPLLSFSISTIASEEFPSTLVLLPTTEITSSFDLESSPEPSLLTSMPFLSDSIVSSIFISEDVTSTLESVDTSTIVITSSFTFASSVLSEISSIDIAPSSTEPQFSSDELISSSFDFSSDFSELTIKTKMETLFVLDSSIDGPSLALSSSFISSSSEGSSPSPSFMEISSFFDESTLSLLFTEIPSTSISESLLSPFVSPSGDFSSFESSKFSSRRFITTQLFSDFTAFFSESVISDSIFFSKTLSPFNSYTSSLAVSISMTQTSSSLPSPSPTDVGPIGPILINPLGTLVAIQGKLFSYTIPDNTFMNDVSLDLLDDTTEQSLHNSLWVQLKSNVIQGLAMSSEIINGDITDHYFKLQAYGENGTSASQIIRIRVFPDNLLPNNNFVQISVEGDFLMFDQNLSAKIELSSKIAAPNSDDIYFLGFSNGSIVVTYTNISIRDYDCTEFTNWFQTIYTNNNYTVSFRNKVVPFVPLGVAKIIGTCGIRTSTDVFTTLTTTGGIQEISDKLIFLVVVLPIAFVACLLLMIGTIVFIMYRSKRWERSYVPSRELYLNRKPVILPGELERVPYRSRKPTILTDELPRRTRQGYRSFLYPPSYDPGDHFAEDDNVSMESENELTDFPIVTISEPLKESPPPSYRLPPEIN